MELMFDELKELFLVYDPDYVRITICSNHAQEGEGPCHLIMRDRGVDIGKVYGEEFTVPKFIHLLEKWKVPTVTFLICSNTCPTNYSKVFPHEHQGDKAKHYRKDLSL